MNDKAKKLNIARAIKKMLLVLCASPLLFCSAATAEPARDVRVSQVGDFENDRDHQIRTPGFFEYAIPNMPAEIDNSAAHEAHEADTAYERITSLSKSSNFNDLFGLNKEGLLKRFPALRFTHKADFSQVTWHGTDTSSVLDLRFKQGKVTAVRLSNYYGYPRPGTTSDVEIGKWISAPIKKQK